MTQDFRVSLPPEKLYRRCSTDDFQFHTTAELAPLDDHFGQERAVEALRFGLDVGYRGYNIFVLGSAGVGKHQLLNAILDEEAAPLEKLFDWCYVNNFETSHKPRVLKLPPGKGRTLRDDMVRFVEDLLVSIPAAFQSEEYQTRLQEMGEEYSDREQKAFRELDEKARKEDVALVQTPNGYTLAPVKDDNILSPSEFEELPKEERDRIQAVIDRLKEELKSIIRQLPIWVKEGREKLRELNREFSKMAIDQLYDDLSERYRHLPDVHDYLEAVKAHVLDNVDAFRPRQAEGGGQEVVTPGVDDFPQYKVNVLVDNSEVRAAPVIYEDNPSFMNLVGRIEHIARYGALMTDFTLIKPGSLHLANGGYLVLDAIKVLTQPFAWEALKRILFAREIRIQTLEQMFSFASTTQLEPAPIPLGIKVILTGDRATYYLLEQLDPEFSQLFKVAADMAEDVSWTAESTGLYARLVADIQQREGLRPLDRGGVARVIEHCARRLEDSHKLSLHRGSLTDLLCESDYCARTRDSDHIGAEDVQRAVDAGIRRLDQIRERSHESILRNIQLVDTTGVRPAQVNGLSVYQLGRHAFGQPSRITATARLGTGRVLDIEREVKLGGNIHSKGVMIISSFMANRYARNQPLPLSATLAFEQSYGGVEGDSASVGELTALLSALSGIPVRQSLAVTGSVNQHGLVQAIGGVNEKIEGFFDICAARGLTGEQGVVIPASNCEHLMLRPEVIDAVAAGNFHIHAIATMDQALELLLGVAAGEEGDDGSFPDESVNGRVMARIEELIALSRKFGAGERHTDPEADDGDQ